MRLKCREPSSFAGNLSRRATVLASSESSLTKNCSCTNRFGATRPGRACWHGRCNSVGNLVVARMQGCEMEIGEEKIMRSKFLIALGIALLSTFAATQENRSEISLQGTGFFTKDATGNAIYSVAARPAAFLLVTVTTSIAGLRRKLCMGTTAIPSSSSHPRAPLASSPTFTRLQVDSWSACRLHAIFGSALRAGRRRRVGV